MKIKDPSTGKETYVGACKATEAGLSVDLIETYRKLALVKAKGDEDLTKKLKSGTFSGGIGYDSKRAMYIFDLNSENPTEMMLWKASNGQFKAIEEQKLTVWQEIIDESEDPATPCPISSWNAAYPVTIKKKKGAKTEYTFTISTIGKKNKLGQPELKALVDAAPIPELIYRFTKYHLEAEIEYLKQYDEVIGMDIMESEEIENVIATMKAELPASDTSSFSFKSKDGDSEDDEQTLSYDAIVAAYDNFQDNNGKERSEEGQDLRAMVIEYINRKGLDVQVTRKKTINDLMNEIEEIIDDLGEEPADKKTSSQSVNKKSNPQNEDSDDDNGDSDDDENSNDDEESNDDSDDAHNMDTNEPAKSTRRRRRN